jgi:Type I restriction modification DNA specificity domain
LETGHTPSRRHPEWWGGDIPWIGIRDATENHVRTIVTTNQHTNELGIENSSARILPANTACLSRTASVGYVVVMRRPMATSQDFVPLWSGQLCRSPILWRCATSSALSCDDGLSAMRCSSAQQRRRIRKPRSLPDPGKSGAAPIPPTSGRRASRVTCARSMKKLTLHPDHRNGRWSTSSLMRCSESHAAHGKCSIGLFRRMLSELTIV